MPAVGAAAASIRSGARPPAIGCLIRVDVEEPERAAPASSGGGSRCEPKPALRLVERFSRPLRGGTPEYVATGGVTFPVGFPALTGLGPDRAEADRRTTPTGAFVPAPADVPEPTPRIQTDCSAGAVGGDEFAGQNGSISAQRAGDVCHTVGWRHWARVITSPGRDPRDRRAGVRAPRGWQRDRDRGAGRPGPICGPR